MDAQELQKVKNKYDIIGNDPALNRAIEMAMAVALTELTVLVTGESGVGKDNIPKIIHQNGRRKNAKYFAVNCGAIPEGTIDSELFGHVKGSFTGAVDDRKGYFEVADGGTLFLDEVGELPLDIQAKLLRVIQDGEFMRVGGTKPVKTNVRIISATNRNLEEQVERKVFRRDLYYRLNVFPINVPSLDERPEDIPILVDNFIRKYNEKFGVDKYVDEEAKENLAGRQWPGNIRELENVVQRLIISSQTDAITVIDVIRELDGDAIGMPAAGKLREDMDRGEIDLTKMVEAFEKDIIRYACDKHGSTRRAAKAIGISQTQLVRKKNKYGL